MKSNQRFEGEPVEDFATDLYTIVKNCDFSPTVLMRQFEDTVVTRMLDKKISEWAGTVKYS